MGFPMVKLTKKQLEFCSEEDRKFLKALEREVELQDRRELFWNIIHSVKALLVFVVVLPVLPIVVIIRAIRGKE